MTFLVAPSEPRAIKVLGKSSSLPEQWGADILWPDNGGFVGVQRKELSDLIASLHDGRLGREVSQMQRLQVAMLVVEGRPKWSTEGVLLRDHGRPWSRTTHRALLYSVQARGIWVEQTDDAADTVATVLAFAEWLKKPTHRGLRTRPGPVSVWGKANDHDWACHVLQGFQGIGPEVASRIVDKFGGLPLKWTVGVGELMEVEGVGPKRAKALIEALHDC